LTPVALTEVFWPLEEPAFQQNLGGPVFDEVSAASDGVRRTEERNAGAGNPRPGLEQPPHVFGLLAISQPVIEAPCAA